ncbi:hypothetical protein CYMTET_41235 [Cymbomonas tetramitiformis]|uniref:Uncharacterized protein n=1 Tax=Cymbomonas tetramitiformis TaxID=36881 RepID=A0AAE0C8I7_9CHLO|nr:hypothetical protein CYMTET_41235 [Cymbomonas tetramitiformis]
MRTAAGTGFLEPAGLPRYAKRATSTTLWPTIHACVSISGVMTVTPVLDAHLDHEEKVSLGTRCDAFRRALALAKRACYQVEEVVARWPTGHWSRW